MIGRFLTRLFDLRPRPAAAPGITITDDRIVVGTVNAKRQGPVYGALAACEVAAGDKVLLTAYFEPRVDHLSPQVGLGHFSITRDGFPIARLPLAYARSTEGASLATTVFSGFDDPGDGPRSYVAVVEGAPAGGEVYIEARPIAR